MPDDPSNKARIAEPLFTLLASGGAFERTLKDLPGFKSQIEAAFEWMKSNANCSATELGDLGARLGEIIRKKDAAIRGCDFDLAAHLREEECALFRRVGLKAPTGKTWGTVMSDGIEQQTRSLSALLNEIQQSKSEQSACT